MFEAKESGREEKAIDIAKRMVKKGFEKNDIIEITGLTAKEIDNLVKS